MPTPRKKWPHVAEWARLDSITLACRARLRLVEASERINDPITMRQILQAVECLYMIESKLKECKGDQND